MAELKKKVPGLSQDHIDAIKKAAVGTHLESDIGALHSEELCPSPATCLQTRVAPFGSKIPKSPVSDTEGCALVSVLACMSIDMRKD